jgi:hypothetical protein
MPPSSPTPATPKLLSTADLAQAVELVQKTAAAAVPAQLVEVEARDGDGGTVKLQVLVGRDADGDLDVLTLPITELDALARARRLAEDPGPDRREGTAAHQALSSFIEHLKRFKESKATVVWANPTHRQLVGVLDYHEDGGAPRWGKHRSIYPCPLSEAWTAWGGEKGLTLTQDQFAELLDVRDAELHEGAFGDGLQRGKVAPSPAELVTLATTLETFSHLTAKREREASGRTKVTFSQADGVAGTVAPPAAFLINVRVFEDAAPQVLQVRLRVTVEGAVAKFHVRIHRASELLRESFAELVAEVKERAEVPVFVGTPEA